MSPPPPPPNIPRRKTSRGRQPPTHETSLIDGIAPSFDSDSDSKCLEKVTELQELGVGRVAGFPCFKDKSRIGIIYTVFLIPTFSLPVTGLRGLEVGSRNLGNKRLPNYV